MATPLGRPPLEPQTPVSFVSLCTGPGGTGSEPVLYANNPVGDAMLSTGIASLAGAVVGTTIANAACLVTVYWLSRLIGMQFDFGTLALSVLPAALIGGPEMAVPVLAVTIAAICNCPSLFSQREREELSEWRNAWIRRYDGFRDSRRNSSIR